LAFLLALLLIVLSFLHAQFSLTATAAVEYASLTNNINGEELKQAHESQTDEETTQLYFFDFFESYLIWVSSRYWHYPFPITVEQKQESGDSVTVTAEYYLTVEHTLFLMKNSEVHEHDHHDFKPNIVIPPDRYRRRLWA